MANPTLKRPKVLLRREAQQTCDALNALLQSGLDLPTQPERTHDEPLHPGISKQLAHPWVFHELEKPFLKGGHDAQPMTD